MAKLLSLSGDKPTRRRKRAMGQHACRVRFDDQLKLERAGARTATFLSK